MVNNFITDMKQNNCGSADLAEMARQAEDGSYVQKKLQDLQLLLCRYEEKIESRYTDSEDYMNLVLNKIGTSRLISGNNIWIYGFDSFTPKSLSVIGELMTYARQVNVVLTGSEDLSRRDGELFQLSRRVMELQRTRYPGAEKRPYSFKSFRPLQRSRKRRLFRTETGSRQGVSL